jgi:hypothetical protein
MPWVSIVVAVLLSLSSMANRRTRTPRPRITSWRLKEQENDTPNALGLPESKPELAVVPPVVSGGATGSSER